MTYTTTKPTVTADRSIPGYVAGTWDIDPVHSTVEFSARHMMVSKVRGRFTSFEATLVTGENPLDSEVEATVQLDSVLTGNEQRDAHLRSADFFESDTYPDITFTVNRARPSGQGVTVSGSLTVRDRTRPVPFDATVSAVSAGEVTLDAEVQVDRSEFGLTWSPMRMASMHNIIAVHAVFTRH